MNYKQVLKHQPELRFCNKRNVSMRLLKETRGDLFVAYNVLRGIHELHSVENFIQNGMSFNVSLEEEMINGFIINDFKANNHKKFVTDIQDAREKTNYRIEQSEEAALKQRAEQIKLVSERTIGTKV